MNKTLLIPFVIILVALVGTGVYLVTSEAFSPKPIEQEQKKENPIETPKTTTQEKEPTIADEKPVSKKYDDMMTELDNTIEVEATTTNEETEVDSANTVTSDSYLNIYNPNEF